MFKGMDNEIGDGKRQRIAKAIKGDALMGEKSLYDVASDRVAYRNVIKVTSRFSATG